MIQRKPSLSDLRTAILRRVAEREATGGSDVGMALMSTLLFMVLLSGLSLVLLSVILGQIAPSYAAQKSTKTVNAAQAGLQVGLSVLRSAAAAPDVTGRVFGQLAKLPCSTLNGLVDGADADLSYAVNVRYYLADPAGRNEAWLSSSVNKMECVSGAGPRDSGISAQPRFAVITSQGQAAAIPGRPAAEGNRSISAIYTFRVSTVNIPGGRIFDFDRNNCLEAQRNTAFVIGVGSEIKLVPKAGCATGATASADANQLWIYDTDYKIKLASSTVGGGAGLCVTDPVGSNPQRATLSTCLSGSDRYTQLWSWTGSHSWTGQKDPISSGYSNVCLGISGNFLRVNNGCGGQFAPLPAVGAGAASKNTAQVVNYKEFGRCLDVTGEVITSSHMISYPCKQDPNPSQSELKWNHKWYYSEPPAGSTTAPNQPIYVYNLNNNGEAAGDTASKRCLQTPTGAGKYPTFTNCNTAVSTQRWTRIQEAADYASSYTFVDNAGRCLTADASDLLNNNWSKITVTTCTGTTDQKWNAPITFNNATFDSYKELSG